MECLCNFPTTNLLYITGFAISMDTRRGTYSHLEINSFHQICEVKHFVLCLFASSADPPTSACLHIWGAYSLFSCFVRLTFLEMLCPCFDLFPICI